MTSKIEKKSNFKRTRVTSDDDDVEEIVEDDEDTIEDSAHESVHEEIEDDFVFVDTYRFLELHYRQLLYAQANADNARDCVKEADSSENGERAARMLTNVGTTLLNQMKEVVQSTKNELERALEPKRKFRARFATEIDKCDHLIQHVIGAKLQWKTPPVGTVNKLIRHQDSSRGL
jgi:hypothetical protein